MSGPRSAVARDTAPPCLFRRCTLRNVTNTSAEVVLCDHSIERTYSLFRAIGARHVFVLDHKCKCVGVISTKDLVGHFIEEKIEHLDVARWL